MPDYGKIIQKSIETTKKFKWLWVYGLGLAATAGGSSLSNFGNLSDSFKGDTKTNLFVDWAGKVSPQTWSLLALGVVISLLVGIAISWVISTWLNGSLIAGLKLAHQDKQTTLKITSPLGIAKIKDLIVLGIIEFVLFLAILIGFGVGGIILATVLAAAARNFVPLVAIFAVLAFFFFVIQFGLTKVLAQRAVVLDNLSPWEGWTKSWRLALSNYFPSILMGIINTVSGTAFGCVTNIVLLLVLAIPGAIFVVPMISNIDKFQLSAYWVNILVLVILLIAFGLANLFIRALTVVFSASNWNLWFEQISKKGEIK
ncbi:MAG: hypothetical protein AAB546_01665 [Patescibacteria group bacterium]